MEFNTCLKGKKIPCTYYNYPRTYKKSFTTVLPKFEEVLNLHGLFPVHSEFIDDGVYLRNYLEIKESFCSVIKVSFWFIPTNQYLDKKRTRLSFLINSEGRIRFRSFHHKVFCDSLRRKFDKKWFKKLSNREIYYDWKMELMIKYIDDNGIKLYPEFENELLIQRRDNVLTELGVEG